jgi:hypothetical protein
VTDPAQSNDVPKNVATNGTHEVTEEVADETGSLVGTETTYIVQVKTLGGTNVVRVPVNDGDTVLDVRQFLSELPEMCFVTHYALRYNGLEVNGYTEISSLLQVLAQPVKCSFCKSVANPALPACILPASRLSG